MSVRRMTGLILVLALVGPAIAKGTDRAPLPFAVGEALEYRVRAKGMGGHGTMSVDGPADVRGVETYHLRFAVAAGVGPIKGSNRTESWLDPTRMAALRYHAREHRLFSTREERVEMFPNERRWEDAKGAAGATLTDAPLDELSFMYFIRSLPLVPDTVFTFERHYDAARNPTTVRVLARDSLDTEAGAFRTVLVEMRVKDPRRYAGEGVLRMYLSDDACRLPVRIESNMPDVGPVVFTLRSYTHPSGECDARR
jgi:hypothetical protein